MKKPFRKIISGLVFGATILGAVSADAHALWFAERSRHLAYVFGVGPDDLDAVVRMKLMTSKHAYDANWNEIPVTFDVTGPIVNVNTKTPLRAVSAAMDYGIWTKAKDGEFYKKGLDEVPDAIYSEHTYKYGVYLKDLKGQVPLLKDQLLQIVPVGDIPDQINAPMTVQVFYQGKPAAGVQIIDDYIGDVDQPRKVTDSDGKIGIRIRNQGLNVLGAIYLLPSDNPKKYEHVEHLATLSFTLPHLPE